jgi:hypothetical protein
MGFIRGRALCRSTGALSKPTLPHIAAGKPLAGSILRGLRLLLQILFRFLFERMDKESRITAATVQSLRYLSNKGPLHVT